MLTLLGVDTESHAVDEDHVVSAYLVELVGRKLGGGAGVVLFFVLKLCPRSGLINVKAIIKVR